MVDSEGHLTDLTPDEEDVSKPMWGPRGDDILYANGPPDLDIYRVGGDGGIATNLTQNVAYDYGSAWSPDGAQIAFASTRGGGERHEIFIMDRDGGGL